MADKFYAVTDIKHGSRTEDGSAEGKYESKTFKAGDEVTGLSKEDMKSLWNAGALEQREDEKTDEKEGDVAPAATGSSTSQTAPKTSSQAKSTPKSSGQQ